MAGLKMNVEFPTRLCEVNGKLGYFHRWEQWSKVVDASPLRGGHPGGQNGQVIDTTFSYDNAILALPDGSVVSGKIESWKDYDDGDQIQVKIDGTTYLVHSVNIVLIKE